MSVRNIRGIGGVKPIPVSVFIPPKFDAIRKVELVGTNTYDVTDYLVEAEYSDGVTDNIGSFNFKIADPDKTFSNNIATFDYVKVYLDYGATAETLRFKGVIEKCPREEEFFIVNGRSIGMIILGKNVNYSATATARSSILKALLTEYFPDINQDNIEDDTTTLTVNYAETPLGDIIEEICGDHHDFYIDADSNAHYFEKGTKLNTTEAVVEGINHISTEEYGQDSQEIITRVRVYGKKVGDSQIFATSSSSTTNTKGITKELTITDNSISTTQEAQERADYEYESRNFSPSVGGITSLLLPSLAPGEKLRMFIPLDNISPGEYQINSFTHDLIDLQTSLGVTKRKLDLPKLIKKNIVAVTQLSEHVNANDMDYSHIITFESDSGVHSDTVINEDYLKVLAGQNSGQWISDLIELPGDVTEIEVKFSGDYLVKQYGATTSYLWISVNGGTTWKINPPLGTTTTIVTGRDLKIRVDLNSSDAKVKVVSASYKF